MRPKEDGYKCQVKAYNPPSETKPRVDTFEGIGKWSHACRFYVKLKLNSKV